MTFQPLIPTVLTPAVVSVLPDTAAAIAVVQIASLLRGAPSQRPGGRAMLATCAIGLPIRSVWLHTDILVSVAAVSTTLANPEVSAWFAVFGGAATPLPCAR